MTQEKTMGNGQEWNIGQLLSTSSAYWRSSTIHAAVKLEIFSVIGGGQLSVEFEKVADGYHNVWLKGPAEKVFSGEIDI